MQVIINKAISLNGENNSSGNTLYESSKYSIKATACEI